MKLRWYVTKKYQDAPKYPNRIGGPSYPQWVYSKPRLQFSDGEFWHDVPFVEETLQTKADYYSKERESFRAKLNQQKPQEQGDG